MAASGGHAELAAFLVGKGADVNRNVRGTALHYAAAQGQVPVLKILLDGGADVNAAATAPTPGPALEWAARHGHLEAVKLLLGRGARVDPAFPAALRNTSNVFERHPDTPRILELLEASRDR